MNKNVLIISKGSTFMVGAIVNNLKNADFNVFQCLPEIGDLNDHADEADIYLFYLGSYIDEIPSFLTYLKDLCLEKDKKLCLIGEKIEIDTMEKIFHESMIANIFLRPLNTPVLIDSLNMIAEVNERMADRKSILIVDDDATFLHMVKEWLAEEYRVTIVTSGMQAITYLANNRPDLILLDYEMPVTSGPQVLGMIRAESGSSNLPVMFLTGKGDRDSVSKVLSLKPDGYLLKSSGKKEVLKSIKKFFDERKAREMTEM